MSHPGPCPRHAAAPHRQPDWHGRPPTSLHLHFSCAQCARRSSHHLEVQAMALTGRSCAAAAVSCLSPGLDGWRAELHRMAADLAGKAASAWVAQQHLSAGEERPCTTPEPPGTPPQAEAAHPARQHQPLLEVQGQQQQAQPLQQGCAFPQSSRAPPGNGQACAAAAVACTELGAAGQLSSVGSTSALEEAGVDPGCKPDSPQPPTTCTAGVAGSPPEGAAVAVADRQPASDGMPERADCLLLDTFDHG